jgi:hypothetical protein
MSNSKTIRHLQTDCCLLFGLCLVPKQMHRAASASPAASTLKQEKKACRNELNVSVHLESESYAVGIRRSILATHVTVVKVSVTTVRVK